MPPLPSPFTWLLYLLPATFREEYGREWLRLWHDQWHEARPTRRRALMIRAVWETVRVAPREHASIWLRSLQMAGRGLRRSPGLAIVAVLTLGVGGGAIAAAFSVYSGVLLRPLPWRTPERIASVLALTPQQQRTWLSMPEFEDLRRESRVFSDVAALTDLRFTLDRDGPPPRELQAAAISSTLLPLIGQVPMLGRGITGDDDQRGSAGVVILSHAFWRDEFGGETSAIGQPIRLDGRPHQVVGVLPESFELLHTTTVWPERVDVWVALQPQFASHDRTVRMLDVIGRLREGATQDDLARDLADFGAKAMATAPTAYQGGVWSFTAVNLADDALARARQSLTVVVGLGILVFLVACGNVANLSLARAEDRLGDFATRVALGAGPSRLRLETIAEAACLASAGTAVAIVIAMGTLAALKAVAPASLPRLDGAPFDWRVAAVLATVLTVMIGVITLASFRRWPRRLAVLPGRSGGLTRRGVFLSNGLVVGQTALATMTVIVAAFLLQHVRDLQRTPLGLRTERLWTGRLTLNANLTGSAGPTAAITAAVDAVTALPGAESAAFVSQLPLSGSVLSSTFTLDIGDGPVRIDADLRGVTDRYLNDLGPAIVRGRGFSRADTVTSKPVAVVDEMFAKRLRPDGDVVGRRIQWIRQPDRDVEIVGVAAPVRHRGPSLPPRETVYRPVSQYPRWSGYVVVRARPDAHLDTRAMAAAINAAVPGLPVADIATLDDRLHAATRRERLMLALGVVLAAVALLLAGVGLYGSINHDVVTHRQEFGVRLALGSTPSRLRRRVMLRGVLLTAAGAIAGGLLALFGVQIIRAAVVDGAVFRVSTFASGLIVVLLGAAAAAWLPARRASRIDPVRALRL